MTRAVYKVPRPRSEKGARELRDFNEHSGNNITDVINNMTFVRFDSNGGNPNVLASEENESPIMMEYASDAKKHKAVIQPLIIQADFGFTDLAHAS